MANNEFPVYNGIVPSWADVVVKADIGGNLIELGDIAAINTGVAVEVGEQRKGGRVFQRTAGSVSNEASLTLYYTGFTKLITNLGAVAPSVRGSQKAISLVHFTITYNYTPEGSTGIFQVIMRGCRYMGRTLNGAEGTDAQQVEAPLSVLEIVDKDENGNEIVPL